MQNQPRSITTMKSLRPIQIAAILGLILTPLGTAWNVTLEELADKYDSSEASQFQPELLIQAWGGVLSAAFIAVLASVRSKEQPPMT